MSIWLAWLKILAAGLYQIVQSAGHMDGNGDLLLFWVTLFCPGFGAVYVILLEVNDIRGYVCEKGKGGHVYVFG